MITDPQLMPDFRDGLEQALYRRASLPAPALSRPRSKPAMPRLTIAGRLALGATVLIVALAVTLSSIVGPQPTSQAYGLPLIMRQPTETVPLGIHAGQLAKDIFGADAEFDRAIEVPIGASTAYLLKSSGGWCVLLRDPAGAAGSSSEVCAKNATLKRIGVAVLQSDGAFLATIPPGARTPTIHYATGVDGELPPSPLGVVAVARIRNGDRITIYGRDGTRQTYPVRPNTITP